MSFDTELAAGLQYQVNLVIKIAVPAPIGDTYFSKYEVDSGLTVDADKVGLVNMFTSNPTQVDLQKATQTLGSGTIDIVDVDNVFSNFLGDDLSALIGLDCTTYIGFANAGFDFADYVVEKENYVIKTLQKRGNNYKLGIKSKQDRIITPIYDQRGVVTSTIGPAATSVVLETVEDTFDGPSGRAKIGNEFVQYTGKTFAAPNTTLTGLSRGDETSTAATHETDTEAFFVERVVDNPIDILLQILISSPGNPSASIYDVLFDGVGIPEADIDVASFTSIKSTFFPSDVFTLFLYNIPNALEYIQIELLQANNLRFTEVDGKIAIAILDQSVPGASLPEVDEDVIAAKPGPSWKLTENRLFNEFTIEYFFNEGQGSYAKSQIFRNTGSQATFGVRKGKTFRFKGITSDGVATERGNRILARFSTPQSEISTTQFLKTYKTPPGEKVLFTHSDLPKPGGGLGLSNELELLKRSINYATGQVKASYVFTSYVNLRRGLIAPADDVVSVINTKTVTVGAGRGALYKEGYVFNLYSNATCLIVGGVQNNVIASIVGDTITFENDWVGLAAGTTKLKFADYIDSSAEQRAKYAYIVGGSGVFADGTGGYKIF